MRILIAILVLVTCGCAPQAPRQHFPSAHEQIAAHERSKSPDGLSNREREVAVGAAECETLITEIRKGKLGPRPLGYEKAIRRLMDAKLKDAPTARYKIPSPQKGVIYCKDPSRRRCGWISLIEINAKNSFGGYSGWTPYVLMFSDGRWSDITELLKMANVVRDTLGGSGPRITGNDLINFIE